MSKANNSSGIRRTREVFKELSEAQRLAQLGTWHWDSKADLVTWSEQLFRIVGREPSSPVPRYKELGPLYTPESWEQLQRAVEEALRMGKSYELDLEMVRPDKTTRWVRTRGEAARDAMGVITQLRGTVQDITERKQGEEKLRELGARLTHAHEELRLAQWSAHIGTFDLDLRTGVDIWTPETEALYGLPPGGFGGTLAAFENLIHPSDRERILELAREMMKTGQPAEAEWRAVWPDGSVHWIAGRGQVFMDESGQPSRMLGVNMDITERKRAEETNSQMMRKLIEGQEQERNRIARELHDDISQRLALLATELNQLREEHKELPSDVHGQMLALQEMTADICSCVYGLSHELHSSILDLLGLSKGVSSWCKTFGERQKMEIVFDSHDVPEPPQEISLCLFRVLQEAIHNAAKHSGVKRINVQMAEKSGEIHLVVSDSGKGFDTDTVRQAQGLGLTSMQERVRLVGGTIVIESKPLVGTVVRVRVPFRAESTEKR